MNLSTIFSQKIDLTSIIHYKFENQIVKLTSLNPCIFKWNHNYYVNLRFDSGEVIDKCVIENGKFKNVEKCLLTGNQLIQLDNSLTGIIIKRFPLIIPKIIQNKHNGIEDIRIWEHNGKMTFYGVKCFDVNVNSVNLLTQERKNVSQFISMVYGDYDMTNSNMNYMPIISPNQRTWEKNWSFCNDPNDSIIYEWFPLSIYKLIPKKKNDTFYMLNLIKKSNMPKAFINMRGTTNGVKVDGDFWFITHTALNGIYYHYLVILDKDLNLKSWTEPFKFNNCIIEFCIGLIVEKNRIIFSYGESDKKAYIGICNRKIFMDTVKFLVF